MFNVNKFNRLLETQWLGRFFWYFNELNSTNAYLKSKKNHAVSHGLVCLADRQTNGRGLYGRQWNSEAGANLTFTVVFKPGRNKCLQTLNLTTALSLSEVLNERTGLSFFLKWPNDIYYKDKKIGGLLTEAAFTGNSLDRILVGVGLNVNQSRFADELAEKAGSLYLIAGGQTISREDLLADILKRIEHNYSHWENEQDWLIRNINRKLMGYGKWVKLEIDGNRDDSFFKLLGVNGAGYLHALNSDDELRIFTHEQVRILQDD